jgi:hypothetical protein
VFETFTSIEHMAQHCLIEGRGDVERATAYARTIIVSWDERAQVISRIHELLK